MEGWKKWYIVIAIVFIVTAIAGKIIRTQAPDTGLAEVDQLERSSFSSGRARICAWR